VRERAILQVVVDGEGAGGKKGFDEFIMTAVHFDKRKEPEPLLNEEIFCA